MEDFIEFTNRKQAVRLYLCPDVPEDTKFETRTRNEIKSIKWFKIEQLPTSFEAKKQPGQKLYNVPPVLISQLRSWIKKRKGKEKKRKQLTRNSSAKLKSDPKFPTDSEISAKPFRERELEKWQPSEDDDIDSNEMKLNESGGSLGKFF